MCAIMCLREVISQDNIKKGLIRKVASAQTLIFLKREGEGRGYHKTCARKPKGTVFKYRARPSRFQGVVRLKNQISLTERSCSLTG
jgi:hypothetical protein